MTTIIEISSNDELLDLLIETAHQASVPSGSNLLAGIREELSARLTQRAVDGATVCPECGSEVAICMMGHYCGEKRTATNA